MHPYTTLALDWLTDHPRPETITTDPQRWADHMGPVIENRIRQLVEQLAPPIPGEAFRTRRSRLTSAQLTASELAMDELLPVHDPIPDHGADWKPLIPDLSDL